MSLDLLTASDRLLLLTCTAQACARITLLAAVAYNRLLFPTFIAAILHISTQRTPSSAPKELLSVVCSGSTLRLSMRFCSWCISDKASRSDDEGDSDSVAGPSKTKNTQSSTCKVPIEVKLDVKRPEVLFTEYADPEQENVIGAEGLERLCTDGNIPMEGARPLLLAWQLSAKEMGTFTKDEWSKGLDELKCVSFYS